MTGEQPGKESRDMTEEEAKRMLAMLKDMQQAGHAFPCPRCGRQSMKPDAASNALSRYADVYICDTCGLNEAIRSMPGNTPIPITEWGMVLGMNIYKK